jgi:hypothetical protein
MSRSFTVASVASLLFALTLSTPAEPPGDGKPADEMTTILCVRGGPTSTEKAGLTPKAKFRTGAGAGVESAAVTVDNNSSPVSGPYKADKSGEVTVDLNHGAPTWFYLTTPEASVSLFHTLVYWPLEVTVGRETAAAAKARPQGLTPILTVRSGPNKTPAGSSAQRIRILDQDGKGLKGVSVTMTNAKGKRLKPVLTDKDGVASLPEVSGDFESVSVFQSASFNVFLAAAVVRWPLEFRVAIEKPKNN